MQVTTGRVRLGAIEAARLNAPARPQLIASDGWQTDGARFTAPNELSYLRPSRGGGLGLPRNPAHDIDQLSMRVAGRIVEFVD